MGRPHKRRSKRQTSLSNRKIKTQISRGSIEEAILATLSSHQGSFGIKRLFKQLGYSQKNYTEYRKILHELLDSGRIEQRGKRRLFLPEKEKAISGILRLTSHGYGFIDREGESSVFIGAREARKAFDGDLIKVAVHHSGHEAGPEGLILEVDSSKRPPMLGQIQRRGEEWYADVQSGPLTFRARIDAFEGKNPYHTGDWVLVSVPGTRRRYPLPGCRVQKVFGSPRSKGIAEKGLIASYGLQEEYPKDAVKQEEECKPPLARPGIRSDLRDEFVITIDPADAKDHDDAVSLRQDSDGNYFLGVHIADVSRYVPENSEIDREARARSFSVYLQHHHLSMLPPQLPGELCSLKPGRERLALSVLLRIDKSGRVIERRISPSRIRVRKLISYEIAQQCLDSEVSSQNRSRTDRELQLQLRRMWQLVKKLKKKRLKEGGVDFDLPEAGFCWDEGAAPNRIFRQPRLQSHQLVEEFMLAANRAVAEIWAEKFGENAPNVFRVHPPPDAEKRQKLSDFLADAGFEWPAEKLTTAKQLATMLDEVKRRFPMEVTAVVARKALTLARYDVKPSGHFGLGFTRYLHFTSPIRRYADLTVHRLIWKYIINAHSIDNDGLLKDKLEGICGHLTEREKIIAEVEREANKLAGLLYLNERRDHTFSARLLEAAREKIFVGLEKLYIEGAMDQNCGVQFKTQRRIFQKTARKERGTRGLAIGDPLQVQISKIDLLNRKLELWPV